MQLQLMADIITLSGLYDLCSPREQALMTIYFDTEGHPFTSSKAMLWAVKIGEDNIVRLLLERGAIPDIIGDGTDAAGALLQMASYHGHIEVVRVLLDRGANVNVQEGDCGNALQAAVIQSNDEVIQLLLDRGADVNARGGECGTAIQAAVLTGRLTLVRLLLEHGANPKVRGMGIYRNAIVAAKETGRSRIFRLLRESSA